MRLLPLLLLLSLPQPLVSQPAAQTAPAETSKKGLYWKATSGKNSLFLLGSIHIGNKEMYPLAKEIEEGFDGSSVLFVEVDMNHIDMMKLQTLVMEKGMYKDGDSLWNHISPEARKKVEAFCEQSGFPSIAAGKMRPWMFSMFATMWPLMKKGGMDVNLGIDMYFMGKQEKIKDRMRVQEIETAEQQLDMLASLDGKLQEAQLVSVMEMASGAGRIEEIQKIWIDGDGDKLDQLMTQMSGGETMKVLITDRNKKMADAAEAFLKGAEKAQGFFVVGAAHMVGKEGIVRLLEKKGFAVERVALSK
ncbi:MAG: TraB/GumN family protein [Acidobacteria bacterium]|nr:TraB/GumN family protein [Acidobacteriota bacterium]